ncbi:MAG: hypothetical protein AAGB00_06305 [Planctomycetota bacterium]
MAVVGSLAVSIIAKTQKFEKSMSRVQRLSKLTGKSLLSLAKAATAVGTAFVGVGVAAGTAVVTGQLKAIDSLAKTADKLGLTTERLAGLRFAAGQTGVSMNQFDTALQRMIRRVGDAAAGTGEAVAALERLGIDAQKLNMLSADEQLRVLADRFRQLPSQTERVRIAFKLFDSEGVALVNTLALGSEGLDKMQATAQKMGLTISRNAAAGVEATNGAISRLGAAFTGFARQFTIRIAPLLEQGFDRITRFLTDDNRVRNFAEVAARAVGGIVESVIAALHKLRVTFLGIENLFLRFSKSLSESTAINLFASQMGLDPQLLTDAGMQAAAGLNRNRQQLRGLEGGDPAADFRKYFDGILAGALEKTRIEQPKTPRELPELPDFVREAISRLGELKGPSLPLELGKLVGAGSNALAGVQQNAIEALGRMAANSTATPTRLSGALLEGTQEARSASLRNIRGEGKPLEKIAEREAEQVALQERMADRLDELAVGGGMKTKPFA